ncbi:MAG: hypothetical protein ACRDYF_02715 [Acidimicrobiia bacterium]
MRLARLAAASAALTIAVGGFAASTSFADPAPASVLVATPSSLTLDANPAAPVNIGDTPHSASVVVGLDLNCSQATEATQYSIVAGTSTFVSVSGVSGLLDCGSTATFTVTGMAPTPIGGAFLHFEPVAKNKGLQKKVHGIDIPIVVIDTSGTISDCNLTDTCPVNNGRPAAPAVANAYLNTNSQAAAACKSAYNNKKDWRGRVISKVADTMPKPESIKDDLTAYPTDAAWVNFVTTTLVDPQCNYLQP